MKKVILCSMVLFASLAHATNQQPKGGEGGNGYGGDGYGIGVGVGIAGAESNASAKASAESNANAAAIQGQIQAQQQAQTATGGDSKATAYGGKGGSANATGGDGGSANATGGVSNAAGGTSNATGGSSGGNSITVQGSTYRAAANSAYAPDGSAPRTSCRLFFGFGGSSVTGSLSGGLPLGQDGLCLAGAQIEFMDKVNKIQAGTFVPADYLLAACKVEGMDQMSACKK